MEKGLPWMAGGYPGAIGVSEIRALRRAEPDEWSAGIQKNSGGCAEPVTTAR